MSTLPTAPAPTACPWRLAVMPNSTWALAGAVPVGTYPCIRPADHAGPCAPDARRPVVPSGARA